jgi:hypothetical protein
MAIRFAERTLGYDIRKRLGEPEGYPPSVFTVFWPSIFDNHWKGTVNDDNYPPYRGPNQNLYDDAARMISEGLALLGSSIEGSVLLEVTELRGTRAKNDRSEVVPLPIEIRRKRLIGYDVADYYLMENRGAPNELWLDPESAFQALKSIKSEFPWTSAVVGLYELECDCWPVIID